MIIPGADLARLRKIELSIPPQKTVRDPKKIEDMLNVDAHNLIYMCLCVFSVSYGPGIMWLLPDAATDTQDEDVF